jgi:glycosyltransferase involved in cell wall biosynthesis
MHIAIITKRLPPELCGIADHTALLGRSLRALGHKVTLIAGKGSIVDDTLIIEDNWYKEGLEGLLRCLDGLALDHLLLQYIPFGFLPDKRDSFFSMNHYLALKKFWQSCSRKWRTSMIVHETYYRVWSYPPSWIKGSIQKYLMKSLVRASRNVFSASELLVLEMKSWAASEKITWLPISSNFPYSPINKEKMKSEQKINSEELILTLFGGGNALRFAAGYVNKLDCHFYQHNIPIRWLLLGGIPRNWFKLSSPVLSPGRLSPDVLSAWLQLTDIFLAPHSCGLAAKRGTFWAAMQHGLPIVGTKGYMTDPFMTDIQGLILTSGTKNMLEAVIRLSTNPSLRKSLGKKNKLYYSENMGWDKISNIFIKSIT